MEERYIRKHPNKDQSLLGIFDLIENRFIRDLDSNSVYIVNNTGVDTQSINKRMNQFVYMRQLNNEFSHYEENLLEYINAKA